MARQPYSVLGAMLMAQLSGSSIAWSPLLPPHGRTTTTNSRITSSHHDDSVYDTYSTASDDSTHTVASAEDWRPRTVDEMMQNLDRVIEGIRKDNTYDLDRLRPIDLGPDFNFAPNMAPPSCASRSRMADIYQNYVAFFEEKLCRLPGRRTRTAEDWERLAEVPDWARGLGDQSGQLFFREVFLPRKPDGSVEARDPFANILDPVPKWPTSAAREPYANSGHGQALSGLGATSPGSPVRVEGVLMPEVSPRPITGTKVALYMAYGVFASASEAELSTIVWCLEWLRYRMAPRYNFGAFSPEIGVSLWQHPLIRDLLPVHCEEGAAVFARWREEHYIEEPEHAWDRPADEKERNVIRTWWARQALMDDLPVRRPCSPSILKTAFQRSSPCQSPEPESASPEESGGGSNVNDPAVMRDRPPHSDLSDNTYQGDDGEVTVGAPSTIVPRRGVVPAPPSTAGASAFGRLQFGDSAADAKGKTRARSVSVAELEETEDSYEDDTDDFDEDAEDYWVLSMAHVEDLELKFHQVRETIQKSQDGSEFGFAATQSLIKWRPSWASSILKGFNHYRTYCTTHSIPLWPIEPARVALWVHACHIASMQPGQQPISSKRRRLLVEACEQVRRATLHFFEGGGFWAGAYQSLWRSPWIRQAVGENALPAPKAVKALRWYEDLPPHHEGLQRWKSKGKGFAKRRLDEDESTSGPLLSKRKKARLSSESSTASTEDESAMWDSTHGDLSTGESSESRPSSQVEPLPSSSSSRPKSGPPLDKERPTKGLPGRSQPTSRGHHGGTSSSQPQVSGGANGLNGRRTPYGRFDVAHTDDVHSRAKVGRLRPEEKEVWQARREGRLLVRDGRPSSGGVSDL